MARPRVQQASQEIPENQWISFCAAFTKQNRGAHALLEVINLDEVGYQIEVEDRPFDGVSADVKGNDSAIWMVFGVLPDNHFTHGVHGAVILRSLPPVGGRGAVLEVVDKDGIRTVLSLSQPEEFALSPADPQA